VPLAYVLELKSAAKRHRAGPEVRPSADRRDGARLPLWARRLV